MQKSFFTFLLILFASSVFAQDDLLDLLGEDENTEPEIEYVNASFKTTRVINSHSLENPSGGVLDIKISHRFGFLNGGLYELFGLDQATIRIGGDYGITDALMIGLGRSSFEKTYDGFIKWKLIRQSKGKRQIPVTLALMSAVAVKTLEWRNPDRENYFSSRLYFTHQMILGRKFSESTSLQLMPTLVHRNLVETVGEKNDVLALGIAGRQKLSKRVALNFEYYYVLPDQILEKYTNSLSLGFDIETGGHVFQLHFTNSTSMIEKGFVTETVGKWLDGDIHFGFNVSRVFTVKRKKRKG